MGRLALFAAREQLIDQSASLIFVQITVPGAPPATDMVIREWEGTLPEILLLELWVPQLRVLLWARVWC